MWRIFDWFLGGSAPRVQQEAQAALKRGDGVLVDAAARAARADDVAARLHRRVFTENHISESIAALWGGKQP